MEMTKKKSIILAVVALIILTIVVIVIVRWNDVTAIASNEYYTAQDIEKAREEAYLDALSEKEEYINQIEDLKAEIIRIQAEWQEKYDNMVLHYEAIIKDLNEQLQQRMEYTRLLEQYIIDFNS